MDPHKTSLTDRALRSLYRSSRPSNASLFGARRGALLLVALLGVAVGSVACSKGSRSGEPPAANSTVSATATPGGEAPATVEPTPAAPLPVVDLQAEFDRFAALPRLPGAPNFDAQRLQLIARAKSEPVVFVATPEFAATRAPEVLTHRKRLLTTRPSWTALELLRRKLKDRPQVLRQVLLRDGYLYSEVPDLAFALVSQVRPEELFDDETIWIQRGERTLRAKRQHRNGYVYVEGPEQGQRVRLLHLDRVGAAAADTPPLHRDLRAAQYRYYFDSIAIRGLTAEYVLADCRYGGLSIQTVFRTEGAHLELALEVVPAEQATALAEVRARTRRRLEVQDHLRSAMLTQITEALPFDEPKTEVGQEDGALRREWVRAYLRGDFTYQYNGDEYLVFDKLGRPRVPQVCIDFVIDTLERAAGSWWRRRDAGSRERTLGTLSLSTLSEPKTSLRQTSTFLQIAKNHPEFFDVKHYPESSRIELGHKERLFRWLGKNAEDFAVGDVILIRGFTPWDEENEHTHAFFVFENDPITQVPIAIAGNAGPANLWSWETEARRTPHRTIRTRIRMHQDWLAGLLPAKPGPLLPPPLLASL